MKDKTLTVYFVVLSTLSVGMLAASIYAATHFILKYW